MKKSEYLKQSKDNIWKMSKQLLKERLWEETVRIDDSRNFNIVNDKISYFNDLTLYGLRERAWNYVQSIIMKYDEDDDIDDFIFEPYYIIKKNLDINDAIISIETRNNEIFIYLHHKNEFKIDDWNVEYNMDFLSDHFEHIIDPLNDLSLNEYKCISFETEDEVISYLKKLGVEIL
jgi:hypothetical protein